MEDNAVEKETYEPELEDEKLEGKKPGVSSVGTSDAEYTGRYSTLVAVAVGALSVALIAALALTGMRIGGSTGQVESSGVAQTLTESVPVGPDGGSAAEKSPNPPTGVEVTGDPEMVAWHASAAPLIGPMVVSLSQPPTSSLDLQIVNCRQLGLLAAALAGLDQAPEPEVAAAFTLWVTALNEALGFCLGDGLPADDTVALRTIQSTLAGTVVTFNLFLASLDPYIQFTELANQGR